MKLFVDTNIFLRYLLADHKTQSPAARQLLLRLKGTLTLVTHPLVISEIFLCFIHIIDLRKKRLLKNKNSATF